MVGSARFIWRGAIVSRQASAERGREFHGHRCAPQEADAIGERPDLRALSECRYGSPGGIGFLAECAIEIWRANDWHSECLYRAAAQLFQRGSPHSHRVDGT